MPFAKVKLSLFYSQTILLEARQDSTLAVRFLAELPETNVNSQKFKQSLTRQVVLVTSSDRFFRVLIWNPSYIFIPRPVI